MNIKLFLMVMTIFFSLNACKRTYSDELPIIKIGLIADPQYANKPNYHIRHYRKSKEKLKEAIKTFNDNNVNIVQSLGDLIDVNIESFDSILPIYNKLNPGIESYHLLGNHEFQIDYSEHNKLLDLLSIPDYYYTYKKGRFRFIVLDATDYAYYSNPLHNYDTTDLNTYYNNTSGQPNYNFWGSAIGEKQQKWLQEELEKAHFSNEKVIIFSHVPIRPLNNEHNLWNDHEIISILEKHDHIIAYINGHNHSGNYEYKNGIHYLTMYAMVNTLENAFGILEIYNDKLLILGYGNQNHFVLDY